MDIKYLERIIRKTLGKKIKLKFTKPLYRGGEFDQADNSDIHLEWYKRIPEKYRCGFSLFQKVKVTNRKHFLFGRSMFVIGWEPFPRETFIKLSEKTDDYNVTYSVNPKEITKE